MKITCAHRALFIDTTQSDVGSASTEPAQSVTQSSWNMHNGRAVLNGNSEFGAFYRDLFGKDYQKIATTSLSGRERKAEAAAQDDLNELGISLYGSQKNLDMQMAAWLEQTENERAYNDPSSVMSRLRAAGINPGVYLSGNGGNAGASSMSTPTISQSPHRPGNPAVSTTLEAMRSNITSAVGIAETLSGMKQMQAQTDLLRAQTAKTQAETKEIAPTAQSQRDLNSALEKLRSEEAIGQKSINRINAVQAYLDEQTVDDKVQMSSYNLILSSQNAYKLGQEIEDLQYKLDNFNPAALNKLQGEYNALVAQSAWQEYQLAFHSQYDGILADVEINELLTRAGKELAEKGLFDSESGYWNQRTATEAENTRSAAAAASVDEQSIGYNVQKNEYSAKQAKRDYGWSAVHHATKAASDVVSAAEGVFRMYSGASLLPGQLQKQQADIRQAEAWGDYARTSAESSSRNASSMERNARTAERTYELNRENADRVVRRTVNNTTTGRVETSSSYLPNK